MRFSDELLKIGSAVGADVFSLYVISQLIGGVIGGLVYLRFKGSSAARPQ